MNREQYFFILIFIVSLLACSLSDVPINIPSFSDNACAFSTALEATIDAKHARQIRVEVQAGDLEIIGQDDTATVMVAGTACASSQTTLDAITLTARRNGDEIIIAVDLPVASPTETARVDLTIDIPRGIPLMIEDTGGSTAISRHQADIQLLDGSGPLSLQTIAGEVTITQDGAGPITMQAIQGRITIKQDGAGDISISDASRDIIIDQDGAGDITLQTIAGSITIGRDGAGDITISNVQGDVSIGRDGAGSIDVSDITGDFTVGSDGSGHIFHANIGGRVQLP